MFAFDPEAVRQLALRPAAFIDSRLARAGTSEVRGLMPADAEEDAPTGPPWLTIAEIAVPRPDGSERDYLLLGRCHGASERAASDDGFTLVLTPGALLGVRRSTPAADLFNDLPIVAGPPGPWTLSLLLYALRRSLRAERILWDLQLIVDALSDTSDPTSAAALAHAVVERIEVLEATGDAVPVLGGTIRGPDARGVTGGRWHGALVASNATPEAGEQWWVRGSGLMVGQDAGSARPVTGTAYIVVRHGPRSTQENVRRYIDDLRRRHALKREQLQDAGQGQSFLTFMEAEVQKRTRRIGAELYGDHQMMPVVTPVAVEAAADLTDVLRLEPKDEAPFARLLDEMRQRLDESHGVRVPGVRVRLDSEGEKRSGAYEVLLGEIPVSRHSLQVDCCLSSASRDDLLRLGIDGTDGAHPADDRPGTWVERSSADALRAGGFALWEPAECVVLRIERVLREHLWDFFGTQEIANVFELAGTDHFDRLTRAAGGVPRFRSALAWLLRDQLTVRPLTELADRYLEAGEMPLVDLAEELRLLPSVQARLATVVAGRPVLAIGERFASALRAGIQRIADASLFAVHPDLEHALSAAIAPHLPRTPGAPFPVLAVDDWRLRPFARALVQRIVPPMPVVAAREIGAGGRATPVIEIDDV